MVDFSHLSALQQKGDAEFPYKFDQIEDAPTIWFKPGTDANKGFMNETLRRANARAGRNRRGQRITAATIQDSRTEDKEVFAKTCATRWDVKDAKGKPVEFSEEHVLEYFNALPDWLFDDLRTWLTNAANFVTAGGAVAGDDALGEA